MNILIAGIGNIFLGDDAFGVEVANRLMRQPSPDNVRVSDFGIRSYDLAYAIMDGYDATILIDAVQRGDAPGTLYLIELDPGAVEQIDGESVNAHGMNPVTVLQMVKSLGGEPGRLYLVGCETAVLETEDGSIGLSGSVEAAIPQAMEMIQTLVNDLLHENENLQKNLLQK
jgi:hydrogenase maturation protease